MTSATAAPADASRDLGLRMYSQMLRIRAFEEAVNELYRGAKKMTASVKLGRQPASPP